MPTPAATGGQHLLDLGDDERRKAGPVANVEDVAIHARSGVAAHQNQPLACQRPERDRRARRKLCA
jgi:hypothetical protein